MCVCVYACICVNVYLFVHVFIGFFVCVCYRKYICILLINLLILFFCVCGWACLYVCVCVWVSKTIMFVCAYVCELNVWVTEPILSIVFPSIYFFFVCVCHALTLDRVVSRQMHLLLLVSTLEELIIMFKEEVEVVPKSFLFYY